MAGVAVQVPIGQLASELQTLERELQIPSTRPLMQRMGISLWSASRKRFEQGVAPDGTPWAPLAMPRARPRDQANRKKPDGSPQGKQKVLRDTGLLMASVTGQAAGTVYDVGETTLEQGTKLHYAVYHQEGVGPIKPKAKKALFWKGLPHPIMGTKGIPARPFLGVNNQDADKLAIIAADYFANGGR